METEPLSQLAAFEAELAAAGIDITTTFDVGWYNAHLAENSLPLSPLPTFEQPDGTLAFLLGNTAALWPAFLAWLGSQTDPASVADPLDNYASSAISSAVAKLAGNRRHETFWVTETTPGRLVSFQRVAVVSGLCYHDPETQLAIHPDFGAWVAFRAVVVLDLPAAASSGPPPRLPCLMTEDDKARAREAMAAALRASDEANLCTQLHGAKGMERDVRLAWAALRDCVTVGREHRYSDEQMMYHYTKDKEVLMKAMREQQAESA